MTSQAFKNAAKLNALALVIDYTTTKAAIDDSIVKDIVVGVQEDLTVQIPTDAATLQIALDRLTPINAQATITLNIASGHSPSGTAGKVTISGRDCSQFRITSTDAEVTMGAFSGALFAGTNGARMPRLACLFNAAAQTSGSGISLNGCFMTIESGAGVKNTHSNGLSTINGCYVQANGSIFTGCARNGTTGAGITAWGSMVSAESSDVSGSGYYGAQAAHGGVLSFRQSNANNCYRHGIRATDAAFVDADGSSANDCAADTTGYAVIAYQGSIVNFVNGSATGCLGIAALLAYGAGSAINAEGATITGAAARGVSVRRGGVINTVGATVSGSGTVDFANFDGRIVREETVASGAPSSAQACFIVSGAIDFNPDPRGITVIRVDTEGSASTDNLDTITADTGLSFQEGHIIVLRTAANARDVVIRDVSVSGASGGFAIQTPSNSSITLDNTAQTIMLMYNGSAWAVLAYAAN